MVSSDSDFAPLVIRLREKGCRVCGIGQQGKTGEETPRPYDSFIDSRTARPVRPRRAAVRRPSVRRALRRRFLRLAPAPPPAPTLPEEVQRVLDALPQLLDGERLELGVAAERLRKRRLLAKSAASTKLFKKYPAQFKLTPETAAEQGAVHRRRLMSCGAWDNRAREASQTAAGAITERWHWRKVRTAQGSAGANDSPP